MWPHMSTKFAPGSTCTQSALPGAAGQPLQLFGMLRWEFIVSLPFDWEHLTGKRWLRWTLIVRWLLSVNLVMLMGAAALHARSILRIDNCDHELLCLQRAYSHCPL